MATSALPTSENAVRAALLVGEERLPRSAAAASAPTTDHRRLGESMNWSSLKPCSVPETLICSEGSSRSRDAVHQAVVKRFMKS